MMRHNSSPTDSSLATSDGSNFNTGPSAKLLSVPKYPAVCSRATASVEAPSAEAE